MTINVGIDVGGTFTDLVCVDTATRRLTTIKVPSTPEAPDRAVVTALRSSGLDPASIKRLVHGSTVSTNALLERTGGSVGLITTAGFEDILEIGVGDRPHLYDLSWQRARALVPRHRRLGVTERVDASGSILAPLDPVQVRGVVEELLAIGVDSIAVCLLHAASNPEHEELIRSVISSMGPQVHVSISSEVMNSIREFERTSTVVVDAYVKPVMTGYLTRLAAALDDIGVTAGLRIMQSSGGVMTARDCAELPIHTLLSGPAGGAVAAAALAGRSGHDRLITLDIGGTSADVALIIDGQPQLTTETEIEFGVPVQVPMIDIRTIGAGGGSIGWIDRGGRLKVGPRSAGARPGPACFGLGGAEATITDANVVLGLIDGANYANGSVGIDPDLAAAAIDDRIAGPLGFDRHEAARAMLRILTANMRNLIRRITVQQGLDPREYALVAFGGGGPVHAVDVARELGVCTVLVPAVPGVLSAYGLLAATPRHDFVAAFPRRLDALEWSELTSVIGTLRHRGGLLLERAGVGAEVVSVVSLDMQFERQNYTIEVPVDASVVDIESLRASFDRVYSQKYGYRMDDQPVTIVNCRVAVMSGEESITTIDVDVIDQAVVPASSPGRDRRVHFAEAGGFVDCPIIRRSSLAIGDALEGPCILEQADTTVVVPPGASARVDDFGNLVVAVDASDAVRGVDRATR